MNRTRDFTFSSPVRQPPIPIFTGHKVKRLGPNAVRTLVASLVKARFGDDPEVHITPHPFRHFFVTRIVKQKGYIRKAQVMARHASIATTQRYSHYADKDIDQAYEEVFEQES